MADEGEVEQPDEELQKQIEAHNSAWENSESVQRLKQLKTEWSQRLALTDIDVAFLKYEGSGDESNSEPMELFKFIDLPAEETLRSMTADEIHNLKMEPVTCPDDIDESELESFLEEIMGNDFSGDNSGGFGLIAFLPKINRVHNAMNWYIEDSESDPKEF